MPSNSLTRFSSQHRYAIIVAIFVACIAGLPQLIVRNAIGPAYQGIPYLVNDSEGEYLSRVHEILDGHWSVSSPMLHEYKDSIALMPPTGELIFYALPTMLTQLPLSDIVTVSKFVYPALLFFVAYLLILALLNQEDIGARITAIAGGLLIVLGYDAYDYRSFVAALLHGTTDTVGLLWNRLVNPITGAMLLFGFLWLLVRNMRQRSGWKEIIVSGFVLAAMSGYIFSFALGLTISVMLGLYFAWRKQRQAVVRVSIPVAIALLLNASYFVGVFMATSGATPLSSPGKAGMILTHVPLINLVSLVTLLSVLLSFILLYRKDDSNEMAKRWWFFTLAAAAASELVYNQQLITGRTVWPQHFVQYTTPISMVIIVVYLHNIVRSRANMLWRVGVVVLLVASALFGWRGFQAATKNTIPQYTEIQAFSGVYNYLNANASKDCVVYVASDYLGLINRFLPAFTSCDIYHSFYVYSGMPSERITHNYLVNLRLRGIALKDVKVHFFAPENGFFSKSYFYRDWSEVLSDSWLRKAGESQADSTIWFEAVEKDIEAQYKEYLKGDLYTELMKYKLDYFVVDTRYQPQVNDKRYPFLSYRGTFGPYIVYRVVAPTKK